MTIPLSELLLYAGAMALLWVVPGPVWVALMARSLAGGFASAWPLAVGVVVGDALWPLVAIFGLTWIVSQFSAFLTVLHWVAALTFVAMGILLIRRADKDISEDRRLTRPGLWAGLATGAAVEIGNPKVIVFYMTALPGFFDLTRITGPDIAAIVGISAAIPLVGNLLLALSVSRIRAVLTSPAALRRVNLAAGGLMILVGAVIAAS